MKRPCGSSGSEPIKQVEWFPEISGERTLRAIPVYQTVRLSILRQSKTALVECKKRKDTLKEEEAFDGTKANRTVG